MAEKDGRKETAVYGVGGRQSYDEYLKDGSWKKLCDEAFRIATTNLKSKPSPAGEQTVVLGPGWPGILLHEAIGHGLEGDFNRKKTSAFFDLVGKKIASDQVSVVDDGTINKELTWEEAKRVFVCVCMELFVWIIAIYRADIKKRNVRDAENKRDKRFVEVNGVLDNCLLYTSPSPRDRG